MRRALAFLTRPRGAGADRGHRWQRIGWALAAVALYVVGWYVIGNVVERRGRFFDVSTPLDARIPLRVGFAWGYGFILVLVAAALVFVRRPATYRAAVRGLLLQVVVAFGLFLAFPVRMDGRPDATVLAMEGASARLASFFYFIDRPLNCFPSMHLALGVWGGMLLAADFPRLRWPIRATVVWIGASVVFLRQHYVLDVAAGIGLAALARRILLDGQRDRI